MLLLSVHFFISSFAVLVLTPNLSDLRPVFVNSCAPASTFGLNLIATGATLFISLATEASLLSSASDSTLKDRILCSMPAIISSFDLPTPEKMIFFGSAPARIAR